jgi:2-keto-4-pentenoate hydratase
VGWRAHCEDIVSDTGIPTFHDPLAADLWHARRDATTVETAGDIGLDAERCERVGAELYRAVASEGGHQLAWKIGAGDAAAQERFGTDRPFTAPVFDSSCLADGATLRLSGLIAPRLEAEIGLRFDAGAGAAPTVLPCIEIIDCRFPGWNVKIAAILADFGLQAAMVFGEPGTASQQVQAVVRRDGEEIARGSGAVDAAVATVRGALDDERLAAVPLVASGSLVSPVPLRPGSHEVDFGKVGRLRLEVVS